MVLGDIADRKTAERVISSAGVARFGRIDTLHQQRRRIRRQAISTQYTQADYEAMLAVNLPGFFHITQLAIAEMEKRHSGHVVQITTSLIEHANSHVPSVLASLTKGGLSAATNTLAIEYAKSGIRVNAVAPGVIKTPMHPGRNTCAARQAAPAWPDGRDLGDCGRDPLSGIGRVRDGRDHPRGWRPKCGPLSRTSICLPASFVWGRHTIPQRQATTTSPVATGLRKASGRLGFSWRRTLAGIDWRKCCIPRRPIPRAGATAGCAVPTAASRSALSRPGALGHWHQPGAALRGRLVRVLRVGDGIRRAQHAKIALPANHAVDAELDLGPDGGAFSLAARLSVSLPGMERATAQRLIEATPPGSVLYSRATHGNVAIEMTLVLDQLA